MKGVEYYMKGVEKMNSIFSDFFFHLTVIASYS